MNTVKAYIAAHWKALMPLVALAISSAITVATDVDAPAGWKPFALAFGSSILVYLKANTGPAAPKAEPVDRGDVTLAILFLVVALVCFVIFTLIAHGTFTSEEGLTWLGAGLTFATLAKLVP